MIYKLSGCRAFGLKDGRKIDLRDVLIDGDNLAEVGLSEETFHQLLSDGLLESIDAGELVTSQPTSPVKAKGKWCFDPAVLEDKTLAQLNVMARETDPSIAPFEDHAEAVEFLSSDYS